jgi:hypothetical protein
MPAFGVDSLASPGSPYYGGVESGGMTDQGLSNEHLRGIGRITVNFNLVEAVVRLMLLTLAQIGEDVAGVAILGDSFGSMVSKLRRVIEIRVEDSMLRANMLEWVTYAKRANEERIETVHSSWSASPSNPQHALVLRISRAGERSGAIRTVADVKARADFIYSVAEAGVRLYQQI